MSDDQNNTNAKSSSQDEMNAIYFVKSGCEYYASARFGMYAQQSYISGNLFHHAVEMLLKSGLAKKGKTEFLTTTTGEAPLIRTRRIFSAQLALPQGVRAPVVQPP